MGCSGGEGNTLHGQAELRRTLEFQGDVRKTLCVYCRIKACGKARRKFLLVFSEFNSFRGFGGNRVARTFHIRNSQDAHHPNRSKGPPSARRLKCPCANYFRCVESRRALDRLVIPSAGYRNVRICQSIIDWRLWKSFRDVFTRR